MKPAATLRGRFTFDGGKPPGGGWSQFRLALPDDAGFRRVSTISNDWTFEIPAVMGRGVLRLQDAPRDWLLKAVRLDGKDVIDTPMEYSALAGRPLEVVITQRAPEVRGTVIDSRGRPATDYIVVLFADDQQHWTPESRRIAVARPDQSGGFSIRVPPGGYFMTALEYLPPGQERERATLERLRRLARPIALVEGQTETATLTLTP
jgi:hypothetical protein